MKKTLKRIAMAVAAAAVLTAVPFMSGCESSHPEAVITISYDGTEYELNYKLYRNMYPQTIRHFIELAESGFYNNTIIHNYSGSSYMYGGGYSYSDTYETDYDEGELGMLDYFEINSKEAEYYNLAINTDTLTPSVYRDNIDGRYIDALPTVIGEVGETHVIQNGELTGSFGALRMYYSDKSFDDDFDDTVYLDKDGNDDVVIMADYEQHSATSLFSIQTSSSSGSSDYCIFGQLIETQALTDLISAIESDTVTVSDVPIDTRDVLLGEADVANFEDFTVTALPIIVVSVEITRY
ncbi:MAG TPA: peptidylprolyl isomerase [Candidatus Coproplasma excrementipullorum]|nr:peptidylprolyl isomerase [Candidatus Coproplasma excrementipullorum]